MITAELPAVQMPLIHIVESDDLHRQSDVPSLRKLEQFDQILTDNGLWGDAAVDQVARNLKTGRIQAESTVVHDTTHYRAFSGMQVVKLPQAGKPSEKASATPVCQAGYPFDFLGCRHDTKHFLFRAPDDAQGVPLCRECALRDGCYRGEAGARQITVPFTRRPWIDPEFPQLSRRFAKVMAKRTAIERLHKLMKYDYGDERLTKRGNAAFQARLDKTLLAMHLVLAHG